MNTRHGEPAKREPIGILPCRGCGQPVTTATTDWDEERRTFVHACGATDPANASARGRALAERRWDDERGDG